MRLTIEVDLVGWRCHLVYCLDCGKDIYSPLLSTHLYHEKIQTLCRCHDRYSFWLGDSYNGGQ